MGAYLRRTTEGIKKAISTWCMTCSPVLKERRNQQAGTLSGGEQQMLAMGRALMSQPKTDDDG